MITWFLNKWFQIARLVGCRVEEMTARLKYNYGYGHMTLAIENGEKGEFF